MYLLDWYVVIQDWCIGLECSTYWTGMLYVGGGKG